MMNKTCIICKIKLESSEKNKIILREDDVIELKGNLCDNCYSAVKRKIFKLKMG